jgi:uncharacterized protein (TIGR02147 family)
MVYQIYSYLDYRHFLQDAYDAHKKKDKAFSYRMFARMAGSSSPNFLQLITSRKLNISHSQINELAQSMELGKKELHYFMTIVQFDHAKTHKEKDLCFREILNAREYYSVKTLETKQYEYFSHWYYPVIRELITDPDYPGDPAWIAEQIVPSIPPGKVRKGIEVLIALNLIQKGTSQNSWIQTNSAISTPSEVLSMAIVKYHQDVLDLAKDAICRFEPCDRDVRAVTIGISREGYDELKKRMESFWREILAFSETQQASYRVMQVTMQMFPLTSDKESRKK